MMDTCDYADWGFWRRTPLCLGKRVEWDDGTVHSCLLSRFITR